jgi:hypothetical protein
MTFEFSEPNGPCELLEAVDGERHAFAFRDLSGGRRGS